MSNHEYKIPPIGLKPFWLLRESRIQELQSAIHRYLKFNDGEECSNVIRWRKELNMWEFMKEV